MRDNGQPIDLERVVPEHHSLQSITEEIANAVTHGIGVGLSIAGLAIAIVVAVRRGDAYSIIGAAIFGGALVLLYLASTIFHALQRPHVKSVVRRFFHVLDHIGIAVLIAGTYTPIALKLRGSGGWTVLAIVWSLGLLIAGIKAFYTGRFQAITAIAYLVMGWMGVFFIGAVYASLGAGPIVWLAIGGVAYSLGVVPFLWEKLPFNHAIWHMFVIAGSTCHYLGILFHVLPTG